MPSQLAPLLPAGPLHGAQPAGRHKPVGLVTLSTALRLPPSSPPITGEFGKSHLREKALWGSMCRTLPCRHKLNPMTFSFGSIDGI